ncbi:MAG: AAA family ATPase, partial [Chloroflexota bacterium]
MATSLLDRLEMARRQRFVGRTAELELLHTALGAAEFPFYVLHVFGPGGVGKTTLLHQFAFLARQRGFRAVYLDGRNVDPSPDFFLAAVQQGLGLTPPANLAQFFAGQSGRFIFLIDTSEMLAPLDDWLRDVFLPQLPGNVLTVLAGRHPPALGWLTDPGWQSLVRVVPLRNLNPDESQSYLLRRQIPAEQHKTILDFTYGHPLALSLVAELYAQRPGIHFRPEEAPNVVKTLLEQLIEEVPSSAHRAALEACALVRLTSEPLLAALLETADAHNLFQWLRELSFVESDRRGLFPHDLAREALVADLRWRHRDWYLELHRRARNYYVAHLQRGDSQQQQRLLSDYIFLHRDNPAVRPYFEWQESGRVFTDALQPGDWPALLEMVTR